MGSGRDSKTVPSDVDLTAPSALAQFSVAQCGHFTLTRFHEDLPQNARPHARHLCGSV